MGMKRRRTAVRIFLCALICIVLVYMVEWCGNVGVRMHQRSARALALAVIYRDLCSYRETNGKWPQSLEEAAKRQGSFSSEQYIFDPISHQPFLYFRDAEPGTKMILLAEPEPLKMGLWPLTVMQRRGVQADGEFVDLPVSWSSGP